MSAPPPPRIPGTRDILGDEARRLSLIEQRLTGAHQRFGYESIRVPIIEETDLYLRRAGPAVLAVTDSFVDQGGRSIALRPELTSSVMRAWLEADGGLPCRYSVTGAVFRYQPRDAGRRQFTQHGAELLGPAGPWADLEVVQLAVESARAAGVADLGVTLGHVGPLRQFVRNLDLSERVEWFVLQAAERLAGGADREAVVAELDAAGLIHDGDGALAGSELPDDAAATALVRRLLAGIEAPTGAGRDPEAIVRRLLRKTRRGSERDNLARGLDLIQQLATVRGEPADALARGRAVARTVGFDPSAFDPLERLIEVVQAVGLGTGISVDLGLTRSFAYYSGFVFDLLAGGEVLGGGGRYDELARVLGAHRDVPAAGFALSLEAVARVSQLELAPPPTIELIVNAEPVEAAREAARRRAAGLGARAAGPPEGDGAP